MARPACLLIAAVFSLAARPSAGAAQLAFVMAEQLERTVIAVGSNAAGGVGGATAASPVIDTAPVVGAAALAAERTVQTAGRYVGTRYRWGGASPGEGFDCSGFVRFVFAQQGIELPRVSRAQARAGRALPARFDDLQPGDLLFFAQRGPGIDHVAIYAGDGRIVHASRSGRGVRYDELTGDRGRWYARRLVAVRRVIEEPAPLPAAPAPADRPAAPLGDPTDQLVAGQGGVDAIVPAL